ncbi:alpha/beta hydrolase [Bacillus coahuilensis m2-6]|uniref:alpha/beta fold hydrolase n=1 Tax=Bacillus coahuilensis TaxID=408580 RepID=UPI0007506916|nr:alpha/beta hydrolase [Bacillus coahuilensis]KUP04348.1 alpha/beta hydrolase [Bacillus coahuilensis m2-6]
MIRYKRMTIDGVSVFYREAGDPTCPTIVFLHGFPSSSHMYRDLIPLLAKDFHVISPDYPGYGNSSMPLVTEFSYTFHHLSLIVEKLLHQLGVMRYILYLQDYGGPIGFRIAVRNPHKIQGLIIQNAVAHEEGLGKPFDIFKALWADRNSKTEAAFLELLTLDFTRTQYVTGVCNPFAISPDSYSMDQFFLDRPDNNQIQLELAYDYRKNVEQYPRWQHYLRTFQPPILITWGKNDFIFTLQGAYAFTREVPSTETHFLCGGHFVLEEKAIKIATLIRHFGRRVGLIYG